MILGPADAADELGAPETNLGPYALAMVLVACGVCLAGLWHSWPRGAEICVLPVGDADAVVVRVAGRRTVLIDGGGADQGGARSRMLLSHCLESGIGRLDAVVLTGSQPKAVGGIPSVLREMPVGAVLAPADLRSTPHGRMVALLCHATRTPLCVLEDGQVLHLGGGVRILVRTWRAGRTSTMIGIRVTHGRAAAEILNSVTPAGIRVLRGSPPPRADVLKVPAQGQSWANPRELLESVRPRVVVVSREGASTAKGWRDEIECLLASGVQVWMTDTDGAVTVRLRDGAVAVTGFRRRR